MDTDRRLLNEKATWIKNEIMNAADKVSRVQVGHPDALQQDMQGSLHATIERIHDIVQAERRERQAEVDNLTEYARIGRTCNGQTQEIVDHFFKNLTLAQADHDERFPAMADIRCTDLGRAGMDGPIRRAVFGRDMSARDMRRMRRGSGDGRTALRL